MINATQRRATLELVRDPTKHDLSKFSFFENLSLPLIWLAASGFLEDSGQPLDRPPVLQERK